MIGNRQPRGGRPTGRIVRVQPQSASRGPSCGREKIGVAGGEPGEERVRIRRVDSHIRLDQPVEIEIRTRPACDVIKIIATAPAAFVMGIKPHRVERRFVEGKLGAAAHICRRRTLIDTKNRLRSNKLGKAIIGSKRGVIRAMRAHDDQLPGHGAAARPCASDLQNSPRGSPGDMDVGSKHSARHMTRLGEICYQPSGQRAQKAAPSGRNP